MKVLNENQVIVGDTIYEFNENTPEVPIDDCNSCDLLIIQCDVGYCETIPCSAGTRTDGRNGFFKTKCKILTKNPFFNDLPF